MNLEIGLLLELFPFGETTQGAFVVTKDDDVW